MSAAVDISGLTSTLNDTTATFTVFSPINDAFGSLPSDLLANIGTPEYGLHLFDIIAYHIVVQTELFAEDLNDGLLVPTAQRRSEDLEVVLDNNDIISLLTVESRQGGNIEPSTVVDPDIDAVNGVVHAIDRILLPQFAFQNPVEVMVQFADNFSTTRELVVVAGLTAQVEGLSDGTVLAPTNAAWDTLEEGALELLQQPENLEVLQTTLRYHLLSVVYNFNIQEQGTPTELPSLAGFTVTGLSNPNDVSFNGIPATGYFLFRDGIIYEMSGILVTPSTPSPSPPPGLPTIADIVRDEADLSMLEVAMNQTGILALFEDPTDALTLFAPTNDAFATLGDFSVYFEPEFGLHLIDILAYHASFNTALQSSQLGQNLTITTGQRLGEQLRVDINNGVLLQTQALRNGEIVAPTTLTDVDREASNGFVHKVDSVLLPEFFFLNGLQLLDKFSDRYSSARAQLARTGLENTVLQETGTILVPNNDAITSLGDPNALPVSVLETVLRYHLLPDTFNFMNGVNGQQLDTNLDGDRVTYGDQNGFFFQTVEALGYFLYGDGIVYELSSVMIPPSLLS